MAKLLCLLLLVTACAAELGFRSKQQYTYVYEGKQATSIPGIDTQWSAIGMKMNVVIQVPTDGSLYVKLQDIKYGELHNHKTHLPWRSSLPVPYQADNEYSRYLTEPFKVEMQQGMVQTITTSNQEPVWVVNIKKSIAQLFQLDMQQRQSIADPSLPQPASFGAERSSLTGTMFRVMENSIGGTCETVYEKTTPLADSIKANVVQELSQIRDPSVQVPEMSQFHPFYVFKTKNYQHCRERPVWQHMTPPAVLCRTDDCHLTASNSSATARYLLDGDSQDFSIQAVVAESEALVYPYGHETEQLWSVTNQTLFLVSSQRMGHFMGEPKSPETYRSLTFQYPTADGQKLRVPDLKSAPQISTVMPGVPIRQIKQQFGPNQIQSRIVQLISQVDNFLNKVPEPQSQDVTSHIIEIERALSLLSYDEISSVYQKIQDEKQKYLFLDVLATVGTNPAVTYLVDAISSSHVPKGQAASILSALPMTIKTPTPELMQKLINVLKSSPVQGEYTWRTTMSLSVANLFYQVCVSNVTVDFSYPNAVYNKRFCDEQMMSLLKDNMIPYLQQKIETVKEPEKLVYIQAIGNIAHKSIIPVLAKIFTSSQTTPQTASKAIYAFHRVNKMYPEIVRTYVMPIFSDYSKKTEVRIAAATAIISTNPPIYYWQKLASSTWFEPSEQVVSFIHSAYDSLANNTNAQVTPLFEMSRRARITLPLVRPPSYGLVHSSTYTYITRLLARYQLAAIDRNAFVTTADSSWPSVFYGEFQHYINSLLYSSSKTVINVKYLETLIDTLMSRYSSQRQSPRDLQSGSQMLRKIISELHIPQVSSTPDFQASIYVQLMGAMDRFFSIDTKDVQQMINNARPSGQTTGHYAQTALYLEDKTATFPSEIGLPVVYIKKVPFVSSVRGEMKASWDYHQGKYDVSLTNIKPFVATKGRVLFTTVSPWTLRMLGVGVENNFQLGLPVSLKAHVDVQKKTVQISGELSDSQNVVVAHVRTLPYTTAIKYNDYSPITSSSESKEIFAHTPNTIKVPFGNYIGIRGYLHMIQDTPVINFGSYYNKFLKSGPAKAQISYWYLMSSLHSRHYDVVVDTSSSETKSFVSSFVYSTPNSESQPISQSIVESQQHLREISETIQSAQSTMRQQQFKDYAFALTSVWTLKQTSGREINYSSFVSWAADQLWYEQKLNYKAKSPSYQVCLESSVHLPRLGEKRQTLLSQEVNMPLRAKLGFGTTCEQYQLQMIGQATRDQQQRNYASQCAQALRCQQHEQAGHPNSADCRIAKEHAAMANYAWMDFTWRNLPQQFRNASYQVDYLAKYLLWPYMSNDPYKQNSNEKVRVELRYNPFSNIVTGHVHKPFESTKFEDIELPYSLVEVPTLLSLRTSLRQKTADAVYGVDKTVCIADGQQFKTFDNLTIARRPSSECWTLLAKDVTGRRQIAVLDKQVSGQPAVRLLLDQSVVELQWRGSSCQVTVDGRQQPLGQDKPVKVPMPSQPNDYLVYISLETPEHVLVLMPQHAAKLVLGSEGLQLAMSPLAYRNRLTGLCGSMDAEVRDEMVGPQGCIFQRAQQFVDSYKVPLEGGAQQQCRPQLPSPGQCVRKPAYGSDNESQQWQQGGRL